MREDGIVFLWRCRGVGVPGGTGVRIRSQTAAGLPGKPGRGGTGGHSVGRRAVPAHPSFLARSIPGGRSGTGQAAEQPVGSG